MRAQGTAATACTAAAALAIAFAGCGEKKENTSASGSGSGSGTATPKQSGKGQQSIKVDETEFKLDPADIKVDKGGKVVVQAVNSGKVTHALEIESKDGEFKSGNIEPGKTTRFQVTLKPGVTYEMYCPIDGHKDKGMEGTVTVSGGGGGSTDDKGGSDDSSSDDSSGGGGGGY